MVLEQRDPRLRGDGGEEGTLDFLSREVCGVEDSPLAVAGLASEGDPAVLAAEPDSPVHQFQDPLRAFPNEFLDGPEMAQAGPGHQGVRDVDLMRVMGVEHGRHAALGVVGVRFDPFLLGYDHDARETACLEREAEAGDPRSDDQDVSADSLWLNHAVGRGSGHRGLRPVGQGRPARP